MWNQPERAQELGRERARLTADIDQLDGALSGLNNASEFLEMAEAEDDAASVGEIEKELPQLESRVRVLEFRRMFRGEMDSHSAYLDIQAGAGGTEAQDWAQMLMRMYLRWGARRGFKTEVMDSNPGEVAGMKSCTISFEGEYAYGWLRSVWQATTMPEGMCRSRTADSVLFTCWPPAPLERYTSISMSAGFRSMLMSSSTCGETNTDENEVCRRFPESNGLLRTRRCTPVSVRSQP